MLPFERIIVRFSIACLVLSMFAGVLAITFPEPSSGGALPPTAGAAQLPGNSSKAAGQKFSQRISAVMVSPGADPP